MPDQTLFVDFVEWTWERTIPFDDLVCVIRVSCHTSKPAEKNWIPVQDAWLSGGMGRDPLKPPFRGSRLFVKDEGQQCVYMYVCTGVVVTRNSDHVILHDSDLDFNAPYFLGVLVSL